MKGKLIFLLGPSGVGKGTIRQLLRERHPDFFFPTSVTTRVPRVGEKDGDNYFFVSREEFDKKIEAGEFLEWASPHGLDNYGTLIGPIEEALKEGKIIIREIDLKGFKQAKESRVSDYIYSIFLIPPSLEDLKNRIMKRSKLSEEEVEKRLTRARYEISESDICDKKILAEEDEIDKIYKQVEGAILEIVEGK